MEIEKANIIIEKFRNHIPENKVKLFKEALNKADDVVFEEVLGTKVKSPKATVLFAIFLGWLGIDRYYSGDVGRGVTKFLFGWLTLGIWPFADIFCSYKSTKEHNYYKLISLL